MTIQQFIEAAIEGGWKNDGQKVTNSLQKDVTRALFSPQMTRLTSLQDMCLDPEAWKAVGRLKGWKTDGMCGACEYPGSMDDPEWHMHQMVRALCNGQTLEEYIATL